MPVEEATAFAAASLSPVSMAVWIPIFLRDAMAADASGFMVSEMEMEPAYTPSFASRTMVEPESSLNPARSTWFSSRSFRFPQRSTPAEVTARIPFPGISARSLGVSTERDWSLAAARMLMPMGWVEAVSQAAARARSSSFFMEPEGDTVCTTKFPLVMVPVLSMTTTFTFFKASRAIPPLKRIPFLDPAPMPEKKDRGTLKTRAQGQLMTRKVRAV